MAMSQANKKNLAVGALVVVALDETPRKVAGTAGWPSLGRTTGWRHGAPARSAVTGCDRVPRQQSPALDDCSCQLSLFDLSRSERLRETS